ncbi:MAG: acyl-ACP--UDP-N-acetylglucosamine O-acyltransferase [Phycisphaerales bacterium]|nr:acyl-ACP--UDP-N-acetylglucosamine O-acyltransferase [Phycisphaerales bacterium]
MPTIHSTAIVDPTCDLAPDVEIGPGCVLSGGVRLAAGVRLVGNVYLSGPLTVGTGTILYPFVCLGFPGQDYKFKPGDPTPGVAIGADCILREHVTVHAATRPDRPTTVGDRVMMMVGSHVGHDGRLGSNTILVNGALLAGHSEVGDGAILSAGTLVHQFTRVGRLAMMQGDSAVSMDVPPFCLAHGHNSIIGINLVGLRRSGMDRAHITKVREAFRLALRRPMSKPERIALLEDLGRDCPPVMELARFVAEAKKLALPRQARIGGENDEVET